MKTRKELSRMNRWIELIRGLYLKHRIEKTEKRLCKYVSKLMGVNVVSIGKYIKEEVAKDE
jgi:hypothetical protein